MIRITFFENPQDTTGTTIEAEAGVSVMKAAIAADIVGIIIVICCCSARDHRAAHLPRQLPTLPLSNSKPVSDRRSRDAAAGYGGNDHIVRAHTAAGTEQRGAPPPTQCTFTRRTIEEARRGGASLSEQRGYGGAANQRRHG